MKNLIIITILLFSHLCIYPQKSFEYIYSGPEDNVPGKPIEDNNGNIILPIANNKNAKIIKIDSEGSLIDSVVIQNPINGWCSLHTPLKINNLEFVVFGGYSNDNADYLWGATFDYNLNQIGDFKIKINGKAVPSYQFSTLNSAGNIVIVSPYLENAPGDHEVFIIELTLTGEVIREKYFSTLGSGTKLPQDIIEYQPHKYRLIKFGNLQKVPVQYMDLDSAFTILNEEFLPWDLFDLNTIKLLNDTIFVVSGKKLNNKTTDFQLGIIKTTIDNELIAANQFGKQDTLDSPGNHNNMDYLTTDNLFYAGISNLNMANPFYSTVPSWLLLNKLDEDLNLKWQKFYGGDACYNLWTVLATQDGGFVMAGTRYDHETQNNERDVYVLKVNENGNVGWSHNGPTRVSDFMVYPNPGSDVLQVHSTAQYKRFRFELYDMNGKKHLVERVTQNKARINTAHLPAGTYVYRIYDKNDRLVETGKWVK